MARSAAMIAKLSALTGTRCARTVSRSAAPKTTSTPSISRTWRASPPPPTLGQPARTQRIPHRPAREGRWSLRRPVSVEEHPFQSLGHPGQVGTQARCGSRSPPPSENGGKNSWRTVDPPSVRRSFPGAAHGTRGAARCARPAPTTPSRDLHCRSLPAQPQAGNQKKGAKQHAKPHDVVHKANLHRLHIPSRHRLETFPLSSSMSFTRGIIPYTSCSASPCPQEIDNGVDSYR